MLSLLQLLLPKRAAKQRVAVLIHPVGEVLTIHADAGCLPALKFSVVDNAPFLRAPLISIYVLLKTKLDRQWLSLIKGTKEDLL